MTFELHHQVDVSSTHAEATLKAAQDCAAFLTARSDAVIGLATGHTFIPFYNELVRLHQKEGLDFSQATFFNLDEYLGLAYTHPASFRAYMHKHLYQHVNANPDKIHIPDSQTAHPEGECYQYEKLISNAGGIDLQLLGIGVNGHIGFNEPGGRLNSRTHVEYLARQTRLDAKPQFEGRLRRVPERAITVGIKTIMESEKIIMVACGEKKAPAIERMLNGPMTKELPASVLQQHPCINFYFDRDAYPIRTDLKIRPPSPTP